jgi:D-alanine-D-alanine ligase
MRRDGNRTRIAVLMGGWSAEREISLATGRAVEGALKKLGYPCRSVDVDRRLAQDLAADRPDLAFVALHGRGGEDGALQGLLEMLDIPYTGTGILGSALALNKKISKWIFEHHRIPTPPYAVARAGEEGAAVDPGFGFPVVVKPVSEGSTIGLRVVREAGEMAGALEEAFGYEPEALVEKYIAGREMTVGVIGRRPLPVVEIVPEGGVYDYRAKYESGITAYIVPAEISPELKENLSSLAVRASEVLHCRGVVRADFRVDEGDRPFLLEVNTIPGMTETSLLPKAAAADGMSFEELVEEIVRESLERIGG